MKFDPVRDFGSSILDGFSSLANVFSTFASTLSNLFGGRREPNFDGGGLIDPRSGRLPDSPSGQSRGILPSIGTSRGGTPRILPSSG